jgi:hypothetical protein
MAKTIFFSEIKSLDRTHMFGGVLPDSIYVLTDREEIEFDGFGVDGTHDTVYRMIRDGWHLAAGHNEAEVG